MDILSPIDSRYRDIALPVIELMSERSLIKHRVLVEVTYFNSLCKFLGINDSIDIQVTDADINRIKEIELVTRHDVKAVEYFVKERYGPGKNVELIHFGLTSQDINNVAIPMMLKKVIIDVFFPKMQGLMDIIDNMGKQWYDVPMLARTHGQPATPTRVGKIFMIYHERLSNQLSPLTDSSLYSGKFGGATGGLNAHYVSYPNMEWGQFCDNLLDSLGLIRQQNTTQIEQYDDIATILNTMNRIATIIINMTRDMWMYISMGYFKLKVVSGEVGSSAMPHKVNPIDFENAEGNAKMSRPLFIFLADELPISRLQRDLTDSTELRNLGIPIAHLFIAITSLIRGLNRVDIDAVSIHQDLDNHWEVVSEGIQTVPRRERYPMPYEQLKDLTRGHSVTRDSIHRFIDKLDVASSIREELKSITPYNYIGK